MTRPQDRGCRWPGRRLTLLTLVLVLGAGAASAATDDEVRLRGWFLGGGWSAGERAGWDVFGRDDLPPAAVADRGRGFGFGFGRRFGGRFLLAAHLNVLVHDLEGHEDGLHDIEFLITGTVLFHERKTWQPFLRGGIGGGAVAVEDLDDRPATVAVGTAAIAAAGLQVRLSSRFSLEFEAAATFKNFLEVHVDDGDGSGEEDWRVRTSQAGWRTGLGLLAWF